MFSFQEHPALKRPPLPSPSHSGDIDHCSIRNILNPDILPLKSPEISQEGHIPRKDIPELEMGGLGSPVVKFTESREALNRFPSHSEDLKLLALPAPAFPPTPKLDFAPIPAPIQEPATVMSFLGKFNSAGFKGIVTDGPSPYWKYPTSGPCYPPPGPFQSNLLSLLADDPTPPYSPPNLGLEVHKQWNTSTKIQRKRQRSTSPDAYASRKYQRTREGSQQEPAFTYSRYAAHPHKLPGLYDLGEYHYTKEEESRQKFPALDFQPETPRQGSAALRKGNRAGKVICYNTSSVNNQNETPHWVDSELLEYQILRRRHRSQDSSCHTSGSSNYWPTTTLPRSTGISNLILESYKILLPPLGYSGLATCNVLDSTNTPPLTLADYEFGLGNPWEELTLDS